MDASRSQSQVLPLANHLKSSFQDLKPSLHARCPHLTQGSLQHAVQQRLRVVRTGREPGVVQLPLQLLHLRGEVEHVPEAVHRLALRPIETQQLCVPHTGEVLSASGGGS